MDVACFSFVGQTLGAMASGLGLAAPSARPADGFGVATLLLEDERWGAGRMVEAGLRALCEVIADEDLDAARAEHTLGRLGDLVARYLADRQVMAGAGTSLGAGAEATAAATMTMAIVEAAVRDGAWPADLEPALGGGILDRVLGAVLADPAYLLALSRALSAADGEAPSAEMALDDAGDREPVSAALPSMMTDVAAGHGVQHAALPPAELPVSEPRPSLASVLEPAHQPGAPARLSVGPPESGAPPPSTEELEADARLGRETGLSVVTISALRAGSSRHRPGRAAVSDAIILERARALSALAARLATDGNRDGASGHKRDAVAALEAGAFDAADRAMSLAEDAYLRDAQRNLAHASLNMVAAAELRLARAELAATTGDFRRAARHMVSAIRCLPPGERMVRWQFAMRHGALLRAAGQDGDVAALHESAAAYRAAANEATATGTPIAWARALSEWASTAIEIARVTSDVRFAREAIAALEHALPELPRADGDHWATAQLKRGHAIVLAAGAAPDPAHLASAAESFHAAIQGLPADRPSDARIEAQGWYGLTLVRLSIATGDRAAADRAIPHLQGALGAPEFRAIFPGVSAEIAGALGDAAQAAGYRRGDVRMLETAVAAYRAALADERETASADTIGKHQEQLAACLWWVGELTGEADLLRQAAVALRAAFDIAEAQGESMRAGLLRGEFERLRDSMEAALARSDREVAPDVY